MKRATQLQKSLRLGDIPQFHHYLPCPLPLSSGYSLSIPENQHFYQTPRLVNMKHHDGSQPRKV
jgi:hypothetical protein